MNKCQQDGSSAAWYFGTRREFLETPTQQIAGQLAGRAASESLDLEASQAEEWRQSVSLLQRTLDERIPVLREALLEPACEAIRHVILEYDFRRRGLRMDCLLLANGALFVVEFKRTKFSRADRDQVMTYAVNLIEFHRVTREWCSNDDAIVIPVLALTDGNLDRKPSWPGLAGRSWDSLVNKPIECDKSSLGCGLALALSMRKSATSVDQKAWINSAFSPSSSILDATLSLFGNHNVAAIQEHAAPRHAIDASVRDIQEHISEALKERKYHIIFLSGAPGAGKTLVGLEIVMRGRHADGAVFVTGNAPLVEVLNKALATSYRTQGKGASTWALTGYKRTDAALVAHAANFKIVKAHNFLGKRGSAHRQEDGRVLVFDEAQRTYQKGRIVLGQALVDHEADLILKVQRDAFPQGGAIVVALIGHNQAINRGERGIVAWLEAAEAGGWTFSIANETLALAEIGDRKKWAAHKNRKVLKHGHLSQSMRYYRNAAVEEWADALLKGNESQAQRLIESIDSRDNSIWLTRNLNKAKEWAKSSAIGGQRCGLIASGQARRLAAEGLFVDFKPDIATWMLAPSSDIRSSNALETVQNQYQIQGLELDYCVVCWDADLRRENNRWSAYKLSGSDWQKDGMLEVAINGYRVLLTRARKGLAIFVPRGDLKGEDQTRLPFFYDRVYEFLLACGARELP